MSRYPLLQVDAFTERTLSGNACAVVFDADDLDDDQMQAIAVEMNLSETSFVRQSSEADFEVRYFTPAEEIPMAGHPTIATAFALFDSGRLEIQSEVTRITLELRVGPIDVAIHSSTSGIERIVMTQKKPQFLDRYAPEKILPAFGLPAEAGLAHTPIQTVSTGTPQLMVPLQTLSYLRHARLDIAAYDTLKADGDFFSPHLFCLSGISPDADTFARHFGTPPDVLEDPFTGSATGAMAAYLWHYGLINERRFVAEQGHWMNRPGRAYVEITGSREDVGPILVGGSAVTSMKGELIV